MTATAGAAWTEDELGRLGATTELYLASRRHDGSLRPFVTIWVVRAGGCVYVRSADGVDRTWFRHARAAGAGRIRAGDVERDVVITEPPAAEPLHAEIDAAYHAKYGRFGPGRLDLFVGSRAVAATLRLTPRN